MRRSERDATIMRFRRNIRDLNVFWENFIFDKTVRLFDLIIDNNMFPDLHSTTHQMFYDHVLDQVVEETVR